MQKATREKDKHIQKFTDYQVQMMLQSKELDKVVLALLKLQNANQIHEFTFIDDDILILYKAV